MIERPQESEHAPFYAAYIALVPEGDLLTVLAEQKRELLRRAEAVPPERETHRYAEGKWSVREVFGHLGDGERVFGYRALCISRGDETPLPGFDEDPYVAAGGFDRRSLRDLAAELLLLRDANLAMFRALDPEAWKRLGTANGEAISVRALAYIMAGHTAHHLSILAERYGV